MVSRTSPPKSKAELHLLGKPVMGLTKEEATAIKEHLTVDKSALDDLIAATLSASRPATADDLRKAAGLTHTTITSTPKKASKSMSKKTELWKLIESVSKVSRRILLFGPPGTGKTFAASQLTEGQQLYTVTMTEDTPAAELRGHFVPKDREFVWMDGPAVSAWRNGARLVVNEIDHASADALTFLFAIMDDPQFAQLTLPTGELIRPAEGFQVICTMNGVPEDLPLALQDRLPVTIEVNELNPKALNELPEELRGVAGNTALARNPEQRYSIRLWAEFANLRSKIGAEMAAQAIFGKRAGEALTAINLEKETRDIKES